MKGMLPTKRLNRLTWLLSVIIGIIFYFVILHNDSEKHVYYFTSLTVLGILLVGYTDVGIRAILAAFSGQVKEIYFIQAPANLPCIVG